jgi:hypothetical protein
MISFITYIVLTYYSINFVLWLYNVNKPENQINDYSVIKMSPINNIKKKEIPLEDIQELKIVEDIKSKSISKIYKKHLSVRVNYTQHDMV